MEIVRDDEQLDRYIRDRRAGLGRQPGPDRPVPEPRHRGGRRRPVRRRRPVFVAGVMEHIEEAGVHSGDSACSLPPFSLQPETIAELKRQTEAMARALKVRGLMNVQFAIEEPHSDEPAHLRAGGQPARQPHRALRRQDHRPAAGRHRRQGDGRRAARRASTWPTSPTTTSRSRKRSSRSPASPASTPSSARRCAPPARSWAWTGCAPGETAWPRPSPAPSPRASSAAAPSCRPRAASSSR